MKLSAPKQITFLIALIVAIVGIVAQIITIPFLSVHTFLIVLVAFIILALGTFLKGL